MNFFLLTLMMPANRTPSKVEQIYKKEIFPQADINRDKRITMDDYSRSPLLKELFNETDARELLKQHGGTDGALSYDEGLQAVKSRLNIK